MSNAYVFDNLPPEGGDGPVGSGGADVGGQASPATLVLLLITALVLAVVIVVLVIRGGAPDAPQIALGSLALRIDEIGWAR